MEIHQKEFEIYTDGGARGNPGPAAVGVVIYRKFFQNNREQKKLIQSYGMKVGDTTNNVAEYTAVIEAYKTLIQLINTEKNYPARADFFLDSTLVVNQLNGKFKVKDPDLRMLYFTVKTLEQESGMKIQYTYIPRERNAIADLMVNRALDGFNPQSSV